MRISDWISDVCSSDLRHLERLAAERTREQAQERQQAQDREKEAEKFRTIAGKREAGGHGYGDYNSDWKATSTEERRVGKECDCTRRSRWSMNPSKKHTNKKIK